MILCMVQKPITQWKITQNPRVFDFYMFWPSNTRSFFRYFQWISRISRHQPLRKSMGVLRRLTHQQWLAGRGGVGVGEGVQGNVHLRPIRPWFRPWQPGKKRGWKTSLTMEKPMAIFRFYVNLPEGLYIYMYMWLYVFKIVLNGFTTLEMRWYDMTIDEPYLVHIFFHMGSHRDTWGIAIIFYHHLFSIILYWDDLGCRTWRSLDIVGFPILPRCRCSSAHRRWEPKPSALTSHRSWKWRSQNVMGNLPSKTVFLFKSKCGFPNSDSRNRD